MTRSRPQLLISRRRGGAAPGATVVLISAFGSMFLRVNNLIYTMLRRLAPVLRKANPDFIFTSGAGFSLRGLVRAQAKPRRLKPALLVSHKTQSPVIRPPLPIAK